MNLTEHDIQAIVGEVVRRIRSLSTTPPPPKIPANQLNLSDRLITLATLRGKLQNIQRVLIPPQAVVSPAVKDELKQRGIALVRGASQLATPTATAAKQATLLAASIGSDYHPQVLARLTAGFGVTLEQHNLGELESLIARHTSQVTGGAKAIWFTSQAAKAVCLANRQNNIWAIEGQSPEAIQKTLNGLPANVLVIDPQKKSQFVLRSMLKHFVEA